jgi:acyl dehydratase
VTVTFPNPSALLDAVGTELGRTDWLLIDQERIDAFAAATGDFQWIHTDPERAATGPFGATIAHGYLTLSLVASFLEELLRVEGVTAAVNAGSDRVRFVQLVPVGSRLRASAVVAAAAPATGGVRVTTRVTVEIDGHERPALVADVLTVFTTA